jgi:hypothetical protein
METDAVLFAQVEAVLKEELIRTVHRVCDGSRQEDAGSLTNKIADELIHQACKVSENFKYIVNLSVSEGGNEQMTTSGTAFWDAQADGCVNFTLRKNNCLILVTVFVLAL